MKKLIAITVVAVSALVAWPAAAQTSYPDFSNVSTLKLNGSATQNGNKLTLTPAEVGKSGSAWSLNKISLASNASFSTVFKFEILNRGGIPGWGINGADGLTFAVQTNANNVGGGGGGIGYAGIDNSVMVEFDTYDNYWDNGETGGSNHVGINTDGNSNDDIATSGFVSPDFDNGAPWWAWVDYNGVTGQLDARWSETNARPALSMLFAVLDLPTILGSSDVFIGFTSGTGAGWGEHNILSWNFVSSFQEGGATLPSTVPEPASMVLLATGLVGVFGAARRRRNTHRT